MNILKTKKLFTYMVVGALIIALFISCKSKIIPESASDISVPTAAGTEANDLENKSYSGILNRKSYQLIEMSENEAQDQIRESDNFTLGISENKITEGFNFGALNNVQILKSGTEYSANGETNDTVYNANIKEYIKFIVSADGNSVEILEYVGLFRVGEKACKVTYTGTLTDVLSTIQ